MDVRIQSVHFNAPADLEQHIEQEINKLEKYWDIIISADVILRTENSTENDSNFVSVKLEIPQNNIMAEARDGYFLSAFDSVIDKLKKQIRRTKGQVIEAQQK